MTSPFKFNLFIKIFFYLYILSFLILSAFIHIFKLLIYYYVILKIKNH